MKTTNVRLTRTWSGFEPDEVITVDAEKAKRLIDQGFGREDKTREGARRAIVEVRGGPPLYPDKGPVVERAVVEPAAETEDVRPRRRSVERVPDLGTKTNAAQVEADGGTN